LTLIDHHGVAFDPAPVKDKRPLLSFHPLAWTPVCTNQMKTLEKNLEDFGKARTVAVGVRLDSVPGKTARSRRIEVEHARLLSGFRPHGGLAAQLGVFRAADGFSERANIVADAGGRSSS